MNSKGFTRFISRIYLLDIHCKRFKQLNVCVNFSAKAKLEANVKDDRYCGSQSQQVSWSHEPQTVAEFTSHNSHPFHLSPINHRHSHWERISKPRRQTNLSDSWIGSYVCNLSWRAYSFWSISPTVYPQASSNKKGNRRGREPCLGWLQTQTVMCTRSELEAHNFNYHASLKILLSREARCHKRNWTRLVVM